MSTYGLANTKTKDRIVAIVLFFALVLPLLAGIGVMARMSNDDLKLLWGFTANAILLMYYAAPLSTIITVIKTKNAASLNLPLSVMQCINGCLWLGYGLAVSDPFIYVPNGIGACTGGLLCFLLFVFRKKSTDSSSSNCDVVGGKALPTNGDIHLSMEEKASTSSCSPPDGCSDTSLQDSAAAAAAAAAAV